MNYLKKPILTLLFMAFAAVLCGKIILSFFDARGSRNNGFAKVFATKTLSNGMKLVAIRQAASSRVVVELLYSGVGSSLENAHEKGLAHAIEHMIFKGTKDLPEGAINALVHRYGATSNAFTMLDATGYWFCADSNNWKPFISVLADCMQNAVFDEQCFASEVEAIVQEVRQQEEDVDYRLLEAFVRGSLPVEHPYHSMVGGRKQDLVSLNSQKMCDFYKKYYRPEFATVVLFGDLDPKQALEYASQHLESIPSNHAQLPDIFKDQHLPEYGVHRVVYDRQKTPHLLLGWHVPGGSDMDYACAQVLSEILESSVYGVLPRRLVDEDHCAERVRVSVLPGRGLGFFSVKCDPLKGRLDQCVHAIAEELQAIASKGVDDAIIANIVRKITVDSALLFGKITTSSGGIPEDWLARYSFSENVQVLLNPLQGFERVTSQDIKKFVRRHLTVERMSRIDMLPVPEVERDAFRAKKAAERALEKDILKKHVRTREAVPPTIPTIYPPLLPSPIKVPSSAVSKTLNNGMRLIVVKEPDATLCAMHIGLRDSQYFDRAIDGIPVKVLSQMFLEGTVGVEKQGILTWFSEHGVLYDFWRSDWKAVCLSHDIHDVIDRMFKIVHQPMFDELALQKTKMRLCNKFARMKDMPEKIEKRALAKSLWPNTVYDWSFDDAQQAIKSVSIDSLKTLHKKITNPAALICVIVGNVDPEKIVQDVEDSTKSWVSDPYVSEPSVVSAGVAKNCDMPVESAQVRLLFVRPSGVTWASEHISALKVLSQQLFKSQNSRLSGIRESSGLFYGADGEFAAELGKILGYDIVSAEIAASKLDDADRVFKQLIGVDIAKPISQHELDGARAGYHGEFASLISGVQGCAEYFVDLERNGLDEKFFKTLLTDIDRLNSAKISSIAREYASAGEFARIRVGGL